MSGEHEAGEDDKMELQQAAAQSLVVAAQSAEAAKPSKAALDDPALGQEDKERTLKPVSRAASEAVKSRANKRSK